MGAGLLPAQRCISVGVSPGAGLTLRVPSPRELLGSTEAPNGQSNPGISCVR